MNEIEYSPWAKKDVERIIKKSKQSLPILDIQLGGACNLNCIYCDTPKYNEPCAINLPSIERILNEGQIEWIYVCGLGEPTVKQNIDHLKQILKWCKEKNIKLSMFSNVLNLDEELLEYIDKEILHILFKLDTFDKDKMKYLYGKDKGDIILKRYEQLKEVTHFKDGKTNLGASIVPTSVNFSEIPKIIDYNFENGIYSLIGQLENAGLCTCIFKKLEVSEIDLYRIKEYIRLTYGIEYEIPICPATISGMHVSNTNYIILDKRTGLSCPWFWLDEPQLKIIGNINDMSYHEIIQKIIEYRMIKMPEVTEMERNIELYPFGGCGGNTKKLLRTYINVNN